MVRITTLLLSASLIGCSSSSLDEDTNPLAVFNSDTETIPTLSYTAPAAVEGKPFRVSFKLTPKPTEDVSFKINFIEEESSSQKDLDFSVPESDIFIPAGTSSVRLDIDVLDDDIHELTETMVFSLSDVSGFNLPDDSESFTVTISDNDSVPSPGFANELVEVSESIGVHLVSATLDRPSSQSQTFVYELSGTATPGQDYQRPSTLQIAFEPFQVSKNIAIPIIQDLVREGGETLILSFPDSQNYQSSSALIILGDSLINDTGVPTFSDTQSAFLIDTPQDYPMQDASYGFDSTENVAFDGEYGFSYTKLDFAGNEMPETAPEGTFSCVRDNRSGLIYEIKSQSFDLNILLDMIERDEDPVTPKDAFTSNYRAKNYQYTYLTNDSSNDGRNPGVENDRFTYPFFDHSGYCAYPYEDRRPYKLFCNTETYLKEINRYGHCGSRTWRIPNIEELKAITSYNPSNIQNASAHLDESFFPTTNSAAYLSSTPSSEFDASVLCLDYSTGSTKLCHEGDLNYVMAVTTGEDI